MPATDNDARDFILDNLAEKKEIKFAVNVVLGPDAPSANADRIEEMLRQVFGEVYKMDGRIHHILPAYAQDYLSRYRPKDLNELLHQHRRDQDRVYNAYEQIFDCVDRL